MESRTYTVGEGSLTALLEQLEDATRELSVRRNAISPSILQSPQDVSHGLGSEEMETERVDENVGVVEDRQTAPRGDEDDVHLNGRPNGGRHGRRIERALEQVESFFGRIEALEEEVGSLKRENRRLLRRIKSIESGIQRREMEEVNNDFGLSSSDLSDIDISSFRRRRRKRQKRGRKKDGMNDNDGRRELMEARMIARHLMGQLKTVDIANSDAELRRSGLMVREMEKAAEENRREAELLRNPLRD